MFCFVRDSCRVCLFSVRLICFGLLCLDCFVCLCCIARCLYFCSLMVAPYVLMCSWLSCCMLMPFSLFGICLFDVWYAFVACLCADVLDVVLVGISVFC